jgi:hypothetical protein
MLTPEAAERVFTAVTTARTAARQIVKAGETAAAEIDSAAIRKIASARTAFLDLDDTNAPDTFAPTPAARALDLEPVAPIAPPARAAVPSFEME